MDPKSIVHVGIGGTVFRTTRSTLTSVDGFFARLWSGAGWADAGADVGTSANPLFIDRDPLTFPSILSYLRSGRALFSGNEDIIYLQKLAIEADYYSLNDLTEAVAQELGHRKSKDPPRLKAIPAEEAGIYFAEGWVFVDQYLEQEVLMCPTNKVTKMVPDLNWNKFDGPRTAHLTD